MSVWARRRAAVAAEEKAEAQARDQAARRAADQALAERPDRELLAEAGAKAPEELTCAEEVREFLKLALPERLKRRALRRLWGLNPVLANVDGLVDYGEDFTDKAMCVENLKTVYTVGKGMLEQFRCEEDVPEAEAEDIASRTCSGTSVSDVDQVVPDQVRDAAGDEPDHEVPEHVRDAGDADAGVAPDAPCDLPAPGPRRMRFTFEGA